MRHLVLFVVLLASKCNLSSPIALNCRFSSNPAYAQVGSIYHCDAQLLFETRNNDRVTGVFGIHETEKSNDDVLGLVISAKNLQFFPVNIEEFFPNLILLHFKMNAISYVSKKHLIPFPNLQYLSLSYNYITSIDGNLFDGLESLKLVAFTNNTIKHVGQDLNLPRSGEILFNLNPCIDVIADTVDEISALKITLLQNCPQSIPQIESTLESRPNLITNSYEEIRNLKTKNLELEERVTHLETIIKRKLGFLDEVISNVK